jgi:DNA-nicking Smr family endonuclease
MKVRDGSVGDHHLWDEVRRSVKPLRPVLSSREEANKDRSDRKSQIPQCVPHWPAAEVPSHVTSRRTPHVPPLQSLDRRTAQKLGRGQVEPEAQLDLHGETLETARMRLLQFIAAQRHRGKVVVLVITGKGASPFARHTLHGHGHFHAPERGGRLRRELEFWLAEEQFRLHVVGFQPAHPRHGGGGAFYVRLRKYAGALP